MTNTTAAAAGLSSQPSLPSLPIAALDLGTFTQGDAAQRSLFARQLGDSFSSIGFAAITGSSLSDALQSQLFEQVQAFFALPTKVKENYVIAGARGQRGYSQFGSEQAKGEKVPDLKEFWHHGQSYAENDPLFAQALRNVDVAELPDFTPTLQAVYLALEETGRDLMRALALYLGLTETHFDACLVGGQSILRPIHYPPITEEPSGAVRAAAHEDINLITLLMGASAQGLQVKTAQGEWLSIQAPPGYLTLNVGDMLQRLTNKRLVSTTHRVVNPPREEWSKPRYSVPFFMHPRPETSLACLPQCVDAAHPKAFPDATAQEYLDERLREIRMK